MYISKNRKVTLEVSDVITKKQIQDAFNHMLKRKERVFVRPNILILVDVANRADTHSEIASIVNQLY